MNMNAMVNHVPKLDVRLKIVRDAIHYAKASKYQQATLDVDLAELLLENAKQMKHQTVAVDLDVVEMQIQDAKNNALPQVTLEVESVESLIAQQCIQFN